MEEDTHAHTHWKNMVIEEDTKMRKINRNEKSNISNNFIENDGNGFNIRARAHAFTH